MEKWTEIRFNFNKTKAGETSVLKRILRLWCVLIGLFQKENKLPSFFFKQKVFFDFFNLKSGTY